MSTLHTNDAPSTILRLLNMDAGSTFMVGSGGQAGAGPETGAPVVRSVQEAIAGGHTQDAWRRKNRLSCRGQRSMKPEAAHSASNPAMSAERESSTALTVTEQLEELIAAKASVVDIRQMAERQGMRTLRQSGLGLVAAGQTSIDEVRSDDCGGCGGRGRGRGDARNMIRFAVLAVLLLGATQEELTYRGRGFTLEYLEEEHRSCNRREGHRCLPARISQEQPVPSGDGAPHTAHRSERRDLRERSSWKCSSRACWSGFRLPPSRHRLRHFAWGTGIEFVYYASGSERKEEPPGQGA